jgi:hypothetical protein
MLSKSRIMIDFLFILFGFFQDNTEVYEFVLTIKMRINK